MRGTFPLPDGGEVRVESTQRYVVVVWATTGDTTGHWKVATRRTQRNTGLAAWRERMRASEGGVAPHLLDTQTGEILR